MKKTYITVDNGGSPFKVIVDFTNKSVKILKLQTNPVQDNIPESERVYTPILNKINNYQQIFIGKDDRYPAFEGQSILIKMDAHNYIHIGWTIYSFSTKDEITQFVSELGNSNVVYDYGVGTENIYLFTEGIYYNKSYTDPYVIYYKYDDKLKTNKIKKKMLHKRLW